MARRRISEWIADEAGNLLGGTGYEVRLYDQNTTSLSTIYASSSGGTTVPNPHYPNTGQQTTGSTAATTDTFITVASSTNFNVGDRISIDDGVVRTELTITGIPSGVRLDVDAAVGRVYASSSLVGGPEWRGHFTGWLEDSQDYSLTVKNVASGKEGPRKTIPFQTSAAAAFKGARAYKAATQSIPNNALTALAFDTERFDTDNIHDNVTNNSRLTCVTAGKYHIGVNFALPSAATGDRLVRILLNGATNIAQDVRVPTVGFATSFAISTIWDLIAGDYVEAVVNQDSGGALNSVIAAPYSQEFWMYKVG